MNQVQSTIFMCETNNPKTHIDWWREWFNSFYLNVYSHRDDQEADHDVQTTLSVIPVQPQHKVLDLCCGNGRHTRALRKLGYTNTIGLDYSLPLLEYALSETGESLFIRGDMRMLPLRRNTCDAVFSYFTSFGYFKTNMENLEVLAEMARVLHHGGWFLLDYLNPAYIRETFTAESQKQYGDYIIHERRSFTNDGERIEKEITIKNWGGEDRTFFESVRLFSFEEMETMMRDVDLRIQGVLGSFDGSSFHHQSPRMILYGRRE